MMITKRWAALLLMLIFALACGAALADEPTYTVTFNVVDSLPTGFDIDDVTGAPQAQSVTAGQKVQQPANPKVTGCQFMGWYKDLNTGTKYVFGDPVNSDTVIYAKWELVQCTVTFKTLDDTTMKVHETKSIEYGYQVPKPADPTRESYECAGWYRSADCNANEKFEFNAAGESVEKVTSDITLYAGWTAKQYTVTFDTCDQETNSKLPHGVQPPEQKVYYNQHATNPGDLAAQGWVFGGWYKDAACSYGKGFDFSTEKITQDTTVYAKWTPQYTVTFHMNGHGPVDKKQTVTKGQSITKPDNPTADGYEFVNWYKEAACVNEYTFGSAIGGDLDLYAKWTAIVTVTFELKQATNRGDNPITVNSVKIQLMDGNAEVPGKVLTLAPGGTGGWNKDDGLPADGKYSVKVASVDPDNYTNYTAVCTRQAENSFLVTFVENEKLTVTIENKHDVDRIDMTISKEWQDNGNQHRPGSIQVQLFKIVEGQADPQPVYVKDEQGNDQTVVLTLNDNNHWTGYVTDLYMREAGKPIQYVIKETSNVPGYISTCEIQVDNAGNYTVVVTNVLTGKVDITLKKVWDDDHNRDGIRPDSVQLKIYENALVDPDNLVKIVVMQPGDPSEDEWTLTLQDLPVYDQYGRTIMYIVVEDPVPEGYTSDGPKYVPIPVNTTGGGSGN